jgi:asparagine synthase (glutamine-hydrolysing)
LEFSAEGLHVRRVAQFPIEETIAYKRTEEYIEHYRELLHLAVKDRLPDGASVVFMSGGLDSTTVAAEANRTWTKRVGGGSVHALTADYRPLFDDHEGEEAQRVADYLGIPLEILRGGECEPFSWWKTPGLWMPEPLNEAFFALHIEKHRRVGAKARVALSGDGGDDVLLGQAWPYLRHMLKKGRFLEAAGAVLSHIWNRRSLPVLGLGIRSGIQNRFGRSGAHELFPEWILPEFEKRLNLRERFEELQKRPMSEHPTHPWPYAMLTGPFWPNVLEGEDSAWSGVALEVRAPLLDRRMVRYLLRLPVMPWCMNKQLVRQAMIGELPKETLKRPKAPLARDPLELWMRERNWSPLPLADMRRIQGMVDIETVKNSLRSSNWETIYENLRPISLGLWVKSVEMERGIQ